jgi:hypothetical protein
MPDISPPVKSSLKQVNSQGMEVDSGCNDPVTIGALSSRLNFFGGSAIRDQRESNDFHVELGCGLDLAFIVK